MTASRVLDLREEWADVLRRRPTFVETLRLEGGIVERWAALPVALTPLDWDATACDERWRRGMPLLAEADPPLPRETVEEVLGPLLDDLATLRHDLAPALQRFAGAWDGRAIGPAMLFPSRGRIGSVGDDVGFEPPLVALLAVVGLRPFLEVYFAQCREHPPDPGAWRLGICPYCGAPPGFADVVEDGQRRLACHLCGGGWTFARVACPLCGTEESSHHARLQPEGLDEGYAVTACSRCGGYVKELDRRVRWNGRSALVEDWGSPHLDLVARRAGHWRPIPSLVDLASRE
jgi:FdhE protein